MAPWYYPCSKLTTKYKFLPVCNHMGKEISWLLTRICRSVCGFLLLATTVYMGAELLA